MAPVNVYSIERNKLNNLPLDNILSAYQRHGRVRSHITTFLTNGEETGSTITGTPLPPGAKIIGGYIAANDIGSTVTLAVSIAGQTILAATAVHNTRKEIPDYAGAIASVYADLEVGGYAPVITVGGANLATGKKIVLVLFYVCD